MQTVEFPPPENSHSAVQKQGYSPQPPFGCSRHPGKPARLYLRPVSPAADNLLVITPLNGYFKHRFAPEKGVTGSRSLPHDLTGAWS
ncbi:MAG TPA: hypothetical protein PLF89_11355 [bacterium]|nr:hypothetical protein [bacterium]